MERLREVAALWNWLPAFRAVAETQHLPSAAERLLVSPSALSRSIGLLEQELGRPLFTRVGRRIELNDAGKLMLAATREALRTIHEAMLAVSDEQFVGRASIAGEAKLLACVAFPVLEEFAQTHPSLDLSLRALPRPVEPSLLQGALDVAITRRPSKDPQIVSTHLASWSRGLYAAPDHPLMGLRKLKPAQLNMHRFVVDEASELSAEGTLARWPEGLDLASALRVDALDLALSAAKLQGFSVALDDPLGEQEEGLVRLDYGGMPSAELFALHRLPVGPPGRGEAIVEALGKAALGF